MLCQLGPVPRDSENDTFENVREGPAWLRVRNKRESGDRRREGVQPQKVLVDMRTFDKFLHQIDYLDSSAVLVRPLKRGNTSTQLVEGLLEERAAGSDSDLRGQHSSNCSPSDQPRSAQPGGHT